jgi:hypothetical protein
VLVEIRFVTKIVLTCLRSVLALHVFLIGWTAFNACPSKTEAGHMVAAVYFWRTFCFDVFCVNPPLARILGGLPVVLSNPNCDWAFYSRGPQVRTEFALGQAFITANDSEKVRWFFRLARLSLIPVLVFGGYCGSLWSRELYGDYAAFVFLVLWGFSPFLLAWAGTMCPDAAAAALGLVAVFAFRQWLHKPNWPRAAIAGIFLGLPPLTKLTWIIAFGLWPAIWCFWMVPLRLTKADRRSSPLPPFRQLVAILFLGLYMLNMGYLFEGTCRPLGQYTFTSQLFRGPQVAGSQQTPFMQNRLAGTWLAAIPVPLPADFVQGIDTQRYDFERGLPSYLRGQWADRGWWYYYLYALAIKEPVGTWCLVALAVCVTALDAWNKRRNIASPPPSPPAPLPKEEGRLSSASWRDEMVVLAPFFAILIFVSSQTGFSVHSRYVLPALPFLFVWTSKVGRVFENRPRPRDISQRVRGLVGWLRTRRQPALAALVVLALTWSVGNSLSVYPHSLSYFNELAAVLPTPADASYPKPVCKGDDDSSILSNIKYVLTAGPRNGPRHLLDSNIDWGQDLFYLEDWYESHPEARPIKVAYFGGYPLDRSKIKSAGYPPIGLDKEEIDDKTDTTTFGPLPGWYALSVNEIYGRSQQFRYFLNFQPVATAGYSIYVYHVTIHDANRVRRDLGLPELPEDWRLTKETDHAE